MKVPNIWSILVRDKMSWKKMISFNDHRWIYVIIGGDEISIDKMFEWVGHNILMTPSKIRVYVNIVTYMDMCV